MFPVRPGRHQVGVGYQDTRCVSVSLKDADGLSGLDEQRFVVLEFAECSEHCVETGPVARRLADTAVDHEFIGPLGNAGIQVVHQHAQRRFGQPAFGAQCCARRGFDRSSRCHDVLALLAKVPLPRALRRPGGV